MTAAVVVPARSGRALGLACLGLAAAAGLTWGASALTWYEVTPAGRSAVAFTGAQVSPSLTGFALVALAGVAALVATGGVVRRVLAGLLAVAGAVVAVIAVTALLRSPFATDGPAAGLPQPPSGVSVDALRHQPTVTTAAPLLAVAGGLLLVVIGVLVALREPRLSRLGARYAAPSKRTVELDPDRAAWQDLDAGRDPTADPAPGPGAGTDSAAGTGPGSGDGPGDGAGRGAD
ncbi:MAG: hypothetical protein QOF00_2744 [Pseudonocardiales bacterium]|nr:hypothetical protein [Pseudonocardiales bacterium]